MNVGESIRYHRKRLNLTQAQLAERLNVTVQAVSRWENNTGLPDITMAVPLAQALGTTTDELLRFGERYQQFEDLWRKSMRVYGDDPEHLLPVALAAIKEFHHDTTFLLRVTVCLERLAEAVADEEQSMVYIGQAMVYARLLWDMEPDRQGPKHYYKYLQDKITYTEKGECILKSRYKKYGKTNVNP